MISPMRYAWGRRPVPDSPRHHRGPKVSDCMPSRAGMLPTKLSVCCMRVTR
jgi:hypothetical protein